jgi:CPA1 family monovalent cation:H+ antiporter
VKGLSPEGRRHSREVWRMLSYTFNGLVFVLLGLQLRHMLAAVGHYDAGALALYAFALWVVLMVLRIGWVWASAHVRFQLHWGWAGSESGPDPRRMFLVSWAAVRGSITLATALSVPILTASGMPFPERELVVFLAGATIILTLALNGVPLPWIIRKLKARSEAGEKPEENAARAELARAAVKAVAAAQASLTDPEDLDFARQLMERYEGKVALREADPAQATRLAEHIALARGLRLSAIEAERARLHEMFAADEINDEVLLTIEAELDEREVVFSHSPDRG